MTRFISLFALMCSLVTLPAWADGFGINATRLIYPQDADSISVTVRNTMKNQPYLVQARVSKTVDGTQPASFVVRPPLFRLEPGATNQIRIAAAGLKLPVDRESIFYFHASAIPASQVPKPGDKTARVHGSAQFGVGNIIKLFYRPTSLSGSSDNAQKNLQISRVAGGLKVSNPSAYHVSFAGIKVAGKSLKLDAPGASMLAPFSSHIYPTPHTAGLVSWQTLNDVGGINEFNDKP